MNDTNPPSPPLPSRAPQRQKSAPNVRVRRRVVGAVVIGVLAFILLPELVRAREEAQREKCRNNLIELGIVYKNFSNESKGELFPQLSNEAGRLMFSLDDVSHSSKAVIPDYLSDLQVFVCPSDNDVKLTKETDLDSPKLLVDDHSYFYLGYLIMNEQEMAAFAVAYERQIAEGKAFLDDLPVPDGSGTLGGNALERLRYWVQHFDYSAHMRRTETLWASTPIIPIMIERPENHSPPGGNVLYMDGHVEFIPYPGKWPMTKKTIGILESLDSL